MVLASIMGTTFTMRELITHGTIATMVAVGGVALIMVGGAADGGDGDLTTAGERDMDGGVITITENIITADTTGVDIMVGTTAAVIIVKH